MMNFRLNRPAREMRFSLKYEIILRGFPRKARIEKKEIRMKIHKEELLNVTRYRQNHGHIALEGQHKTLESKMKQIKRVIKGVARI